MPRSFSGDHAPDKRFMPHGHCYMWRPDLLWTNVIADGLIALSYVTIPFTLATQLDSLRAADRVLLMGAGSGMNAACLEVVW